MMGLGSDDFVIFQGARILRFQPLIFRVVQFLLPQRSVFEVEHRDQAANPQTLPKERSKTVVNLEFSPYFST